MSVSNINITSKNTGKISISVKPTTPLTISPKAQTSVSIKGVVGASHDLTGTDFGLLYKDGENKVSTSVVTYNANTQLVTFPSGISPLSIYDQNDSRGTSGQVLSSTGTGLDWINLSEISGVDGTGTANYLAKWTDSDTITDSTIYDNGTNVGIGTSSPTQKLDVVGKIQSSSDIYVGLYNKLAWGNNGYNYLKFSGGYLNMGYTADAFKFDMNSSTTKSIEMVGDSNFQILGKSNKHILLTPQGTGNVGIGTTSPSEKLHVSGKIIATGGTITAFASNTSKAIIDNVSGGGRLRLLSDNGSIELKSKGGDSYFNAGNVGIGTSNPYAPLDVVSNSSGNGIDLRSNSANSYAQIKFYNNDHTSNTGSIINYHNSGSPDFAFRLLSGAGTVERMRITSAGRVGIGTTAPSEKLHVVGNSKIEGTLTIVNTKIQDVNGQVYFDNLTNGGDIFIRTRDDQGGVDTGILINGTDKTVSLRYNTLERLKTSLDGIDVTGNINLGGGGYLKSSTRTNILLDRPSDARMVFNTLYQSSTTGGYDFTTGSTSRMVITGDGNVGIGTTSPSMKLHIDAAKRQHMLFESSAETGLNKIVGFFAPEDHKIEFGPSNGLTGESGTKIQVAGDSYSIPSYIGLNVNDSRIATLNSTGLGIGTTSPAEKLHVLGKTIIQAPNGSNTVLELRNPVNNDRGIRIVGSATGSGASAKFYVEGFGAGGALESKIDWSPANNLTYNLGYASRVWHTTYTQNIKGRNNTSEGELNLRSGTTSSPLTFGIDTTEYMRVHSNGNVGIGTTSPNRKLDVYGDIALQNPSYYSGTYDWKFGQDSGNGRLTISYYGSEKAAIKDNGYVGIGTISPAEKLDVAGNIKISGNDQFIYGPSNTEYIRFYTPGNFLILSGQNGVRIDGKLRASGLYNSDGTDALNFYSNYDGIDKVTRFYNTFVAEDSTDPFAMSRGDLEFRIDSNNDSTTSAFKITKDAGAELMRVNEDGNVGIGTTTPSHKLHVNNGSNDLLLTRDVGTAVRIGIGSSNPSYAIDLGAYSDNAIGGIKYLRFYNGTDRLDVNGNGRFGFRASKGYYFYPTTDSPSGDSYGVAIRHLRDSSTGLNDNILLVQQSDSTDVFAVKGNGETQVLGDLSVTGSTTFESDLTVNGDFTVNGTTTTINSTTLTVDDKNIVLAQGAADSAAADGAGITIDGADATLTYTNAGTNFVFNKNVNIDRGASSAVSRVIGNLAAVRIRRTSYTEGSAGLDLMVDSTNNHKIATLSSVDLQFHTNDTERLRITSTGSVGIGTTAPAQKLDVNGYIASSKLVGRGTATLTAGSHVASSTAFGVHYNSNQNATSGSKSILNAFGTWSPNSGAGNFIGVEVSPTLNQTATATGSATGFYYNPTVTSVLGTHRAIETTAGDVIFNGGNVGIGTNSPTVPLHVNGDLLVNNEIRFVDTAMRIFRSGDDMRLRTNNSDRMTITSTGNVGIGTTSPDTKLHIEDADPRIRLTDTDGTDTFGDVYQQNGALKIESRNGTTFGNINFQGSNGTTESEYARFNSAGNFGIGTNSPAARLDIQSPVGGQSTLLKIKSTNSSAEPMLQFDNNINTLGKIGGVNGGGLIFKTLNNVEAMRIASDGNIGIGVTDPTAKLRISGGTSAGNATTFIVGSSAYNGNLTNAAWSPHRFELFAGKAETGGGNLFTALKLINTGTEAAGGVFTDHISRAYGEIDKDITSLTNFTANLRSWSPPTGPNTLTHHYGINISALTVGANGTVTNNYGIYLNPGTAATSNYGVYQSGSNVDNYFQGNVAIGTGSTPVDQLSVRGASAGSITIGGGANTVGEEFGALKFYQHIAGQGVGAKITATKGNNWVSGNLLFHTGENNVTSPNMIITSTGRVGIGTTSPSGHLHVVDSGNLSSGGVFIENTGTSAASLVLQNTDGTSKLFVNNGSTTLRNTRSGFPNYSVDIGGQGVKIKEGNGGLNSHASAILDLDSTTQGVLFPRMTEANRTSIGSPATGLIVYQTDGDEGLYIYKSTGWIQII